MVLKGFLADFPRVHYSFTKLAPCFITKDAGDAETLTQGNDASRKYFRATKELLGCHLKMPSAQTNLRAYPGRLWPPPPPPAWLFSGPNVKPIALFLFFFFFFLLISGHFEWVFKDTFFKHSLRARATRTHSLFLKSQNSWKLLNKHLVPTLPLIFFLQYMGLHFVRQIPSQGTLQENTGRNPAPAPHHHVCRKYSAARMHKPLRMSPMESGSEEGNLLPSRHLAGVGQTGEPHLQACQWELHLTIFQKPDPGRGFSPPRFCVSQKAT